MRMRHIFGRQYRNEGVSPFAVELVDQGQDRHVAQPANLEEFAICSSIPHSGVEFLTALLTAVGAVGIGFDFLYGTLRLLRGSAAPAKGNRHLCGIRIVFAKQNLRLARVDEV